MSPLLPVLRKHVFSVVVATDGTSQREQADLREAVTKALIAALPPGTGIGDVLWESGTCDVYKKEADRA